MNTRRIAFYILEQVLSITAMAVALFWSAGRMDWWAAWGAIAVWVVVFTAMDVLLIRFNPGLMEERQAPPQGAKRWDRAILSSLRLLQLARYILAGLDLRHGWTTDFPPAAQWIGMGVCILSYAVLIWAMVSNTFFSQIVRIQFERGHAVATQGPYRYVRHPAYVGMILFELGMGALLGSWPAILVGGICGILVILRTALEDRTLQKELAGYTDYARQVRFRLLPGIW